MSTNIKLKRSSVQGKTPLTTDLELGELAINTYDGKLYMKKDDGTESIVDITSGGGSYGDSDVDTHLNTSTAANNQILSWNGSDYDWIDQSGGSASIAVSNTAPVSPSNGDAWFNSEDGSLSVYYEDGDSNQWVVTSGPQGPAGASGISTGKAIAMAIVFG